MKRILLETIMVAALIIVSGIVLADDFTLTSTNKQHNSNNEIQKKHTKKSIFSYHIEPKNKINIEHKRNQLVNDNQYYYAEGNIG